MNRLALSGLPPTPPRVVGLRALASAMDYRQPPSQTPGPPVGLTLCVVFAIAYAITSAFAGLQLIRLNGRGAPWTTQKVLHVLVVLATCVRATFFCLSMKTWGWTSGDLSAAEPMARMAFYVCDELPTMVFFTVYTAVTLFWAEMYYIASDAARIYEDTVQPVDSVVNTAAYVFLVGLWLLFATRWADYVYYVNRAYAIFVSVLYVCTAALLFAFGRSAAKELHQVPIELQMRRKKLREVSVMTTAITASMVGRALVLVAFADQPLPVNSLFAVFLASVYFGALELLPVVLVLYYYRRMPQPANRKLLAEEQGMLFSARPAQSAGGQAHHDAAHDAIRRLSELRFEQTDL